MTIFWSIKYYLGLDMVYKKSGDKTMKKVIACIFTLIACFGVFAQERIAVFPFEDLDNVFTQNESVMFYREFSNE
ncbi:MAG: hypothetical protein FWG29_11220, partial [Treponema sp.]|nr:hypothetical protein [Treponema sp.]